MKQLCVLACVLFFSRLVLCLTNQEFYEIALAYVTDDGSVEPFEDADNDVCYDENDDVIELPGGPDGSVEPFEDADNDVCYDETDDAIELPGGPDDEVDIEYLIKRMSFTPDKDTACIGVSYLPRNKGFRVYFKLNGHKVFNKEISLRHPPSLCYGIPGLKRFAKVCLEIYNVDLRQKRLCARITGKLDLKFKRFKVHLKLGCFRIPLAQEDALESLLGDKDLFIYDEQAPEALDFLLTLSDVISEDFIPVFPLMAEVDDVKLSQTAIQQSKVNNRDDDETGNPIDQMLSMEVTDEYRKLRKALVSDPTLFAENESEPLESSEDEQNLLDNKLRFE